MISSTWGTTPEERRLVFPSDRLIEGHQAAVYRGITVRAPAETVFRWLCQLRVAPYSYDRLDNAGVESPRQLTQGLDELAIGQRFMTIFTLEMFEQDRYVVLRFDPAADIFKSFIDDLVICYLVVPGEDACRLLAKFSMRYRRGLLGGLARVGLPWGDLLMARKQLMTLRDLAEQT